MKRLQERAEAIGRLAQRRTAERIGERLQGERGIDVEVQSEGVVLSGGRLMRRWLDEASLRFITGQLR